MKELADQLPPRLGATVKVMVETKRNLCALATLVLPITFSMVVLFRYVLHLDLFAYEEWLLPISFWPYFLASAVGSYDDTQIRADVIEVYFKSPKSQWWRKIVVSLIENFICGAMVYWAWLLIVNDVTSYPFWQKTIALRIPFFVPHLGILVGLCFMLFYGLQHLYVLLRTGPQALAPDTFDTLDQKELN